MAFVEKRLQALFDKGIFCNMPRSINMASAVSSASGDFR